MDIYNLLKFLIENSEVSESVIGIGIRVERGNGDNGVIDSYVHPKSGKLYYLWGCKGTECFYGFHRLEKKYADIYCCENNAWEGFKRWFMADEEI
jgi:hypothetical protein